MTTLNDLVKQHGLVGVTFISPRGEKVKWEQGAFTYRDTPDGYAFEEYHVDPNEEGWVVEEPEHIETRWVNVYQSSEGKVIIGSPEPCRKNSDQLARGIADRVACVKVEIKWKRGQFDK